MHRGFRHATFYHARQIWTFHATQKTEKSRPDVVKLLYEKACGYDPKRGGEGPGGVEQHFLSYIQKNGAPLLAGGALRESGSGPTNNHRFSVGHDDYCRVTGDLGEEVAG